MPSIKIIEPTRKKITSRKRVAAYARVSMETDQLLHSLSAQISFYSSLIQKNPEWEFAGVYADEGVTGVKTTPRKEFHRLMADCDDGKINLVITKSVSRFARDTVDCLNAIRHLKDIGVEVRFEREGISTFSADGELLLTLLASFAQAESESIGANVRWALRKKFQQGIPNGHKAPYGYYWDGADGIFRVIPEQGEVVKEIYKRYISGESAYKIAKDLEKQGVVGQSGRPMCDSTIKDILSSISYTGTMLLQKNFQAEHHVRKKNKGELPMYAVEEMFEPLVTIEDFEKAKAIRKERAEGRANKNPKLTKFSGRVTCGKCGGGISRRTAKGHKYWVCNAKERKGRDVCDMKTLREEELESATVSALGEMSDEEFRRKVSSIRVYEDKIEFRLDSGRAKIIQRK